MCIRDRCCNDVLQLNILQQKRCLKLIMFTSVISGGMIYNANLRPTSLCELFPHSCFFAIRSVLLSIYRLLSVIQIRVQYFIIIFIESRMPDVYKRQALCYVYKKVSADVGNKKVAKVFISNVDAKKNVFETFWC